MKNFKMNKKFYLLGSISIVLLTSYYLIFSGRLNDVQLIRHIVFVALLLIIITLGVLLSKDIIQPLQQEVLFTKKLADGDFSDKITISRNDELGSLADNLNKITDIIKTKDKYLNLIPAPVVAMDTEFNILFINHEGAKIFNEKPETLIGKKCYNLFKTSHCNTSECRCFQAMNKDGIFVGETVAKLPSGDLPIQYTAASLKDENGKITGALEYVTNISGLKNVINEANLKVEYLNNIPTPVMVIDKEFNVQYMNTAGAHVVGQTAESVKGKKCFTLFDTEHCNTANCQLSKAMLQDRVCTDDTIANPVSGKIPIRYTGAPLKDNQGNIIGALEYVLDISKEVEITNGILNLATSAAEGLLEERADEEKFLGNYKRIIQAVNKTMDNIIYPLNIAAEYINKISIGDTPSKITDEYKGDFNKIKNNINALIDAINMIVDRARKISKGDLKVNIQKRSENDELMQSLSDMIENLNIISQKARLISDGDLSIKLDKRSENDELMQSLSDMVLQLQTIIQGIIDSANNIASASQQLSATSQQVSQGASEQAASTEQVSSSIEEMSANIQQNTGNAQETEKISSSASVKIKEGFKSSEISVSAMKEIAQKINIINDIAFQTNILALNAAVEAARAGEHGRGFAVVAAEVRKLAEKSKIAADQIDELSKNGVEISEKAGKQLADAVPEIGKTAQLIQEIAAASIEQNSGVAQISDAIQLLNQVTQQNAAGSEEMATSAEELSAQAEQLKSLVSFFRIDTKNNRDHFIITQKVKNKPTDDKNINTKIKKKNQGIDLNITENDSDINFESFG